VLVLHSFEELTIMDYAPDSLAKTLAQLDEQLNAPSRLAKNLEALEDDVGDLRQRVESHRARDSQTDADHDYQLHELREAVRDLQARHVPVGEITKMLSKLWDDMHAALDEERQPETDVESANKALTTAAASYLDEQSTRADATKVVTWLVKSFGRRGGKIVNYNKELAGRLLLSKSISPQEHENWKKYGRLPDDVTLQSAGRAQDETDRAMMNAYALASVNLSPLAVQHLLMHRR
jgi:hypothetical protein